MLYNDAGGSMRMIAFIGKWEMLNRKGIMDARFLSLYVSFRDMMTRGTGARLRLTEQTAGASSE